MRIILKSQCRYIQSLLWLNLMYIHWIIHMCIYLKACIYKLIKINAKSRYICVYTLYLLCICNFYKLFIHERFVHTHIYDFFFFYSRFVECLCSTFSISYFISCVFGVASLSINLFEVSKTCCINIIFSYFFLINELFAHLSS